MFGEKFDLEFYLDKNEKWNQPCENMKTEHEIYRYSPPQILQKGKSPRIYFTIFFEPGFAGPEKNSVATILYHQCTIVTSYGRLWWFNHCIFRSDR